MTNLNETAKKMAKILTGRGLDVSVSGSTIAVEIDGTELETLGAIYPAFDLPIDGSEMTYDDATIEIEKSDKIYIELW